MSCVEKVEAAICKDYFLSLFFAQDGLELRDRNDFLLKHSVVNGVGFRLIGLVV